MSYLNKTMGKNYIIIGRNGVGSGEKEIFEIYQELLRRILAL